MTRSVARASVIIPAHDEGAVIARCLAAVAASDRPGELEVVVVANGCGDDTVERARDFETLLPRLTVVDLTTPSKTAALNAGDEIATAFPRVYLDADIEFGPGALDALVEALEAPRARVAAPRVVFDISRASWAVRCFFDVFEKLPYATNGLVGLGVYAVSREGRARFERFPELTADDLFVQQWFRADERLETSGTFRVSVPQRLRDLVAVRTRGVTGKTELAELDITPHPLSEVSSSTVRAFAAIIRRDPRMAVAVAVYVGVTFASRARARSADGHWLRDESSRAPQPTAT